MVMKRFPPTIAAVALLTVAAQKASAQFYAVRFNTLALATGTISGGMDVAVSKKRRSI